MPKKLIWSKNTQNTTKKTRRSKMSRKRYRNLRKILCRNSKRSIMSLWESPPVMQWRLVMARCIQALVIYSDTGQTHLGTSQKISQYLQTISDILETKVLLQTPITVANPFQTFSIPLLLGTKCMQQRRAQALFNLPLHHWSPVLQVIAPATVHNPSFSDFVSMPQFLAVISTRPSFLLGKLSVKLTTCGSNLTSREN